MRAVRVHATGGPEMLTIEELPEPVPGPGEVRVRVAACGVNFIDVYLRRGQIPRQVPFTLGLEAAGTVDALGPGVDEVELGDRVAVVQHPGTHAEAVVVPVELSFQDAAFDEKPHNPTSYVPAGNR
jgi:NADPH:quinone reductase